MIIGHCYRVCQRRLAANPGVIMEAGMPVGKSLLDPWRKRFDPLRARIEIFLSGQPHSDPLYLTNRTWQQKLKIASLIAVAALLLITLVTIGATDPFRLDRKSTRLGKECRFRW